MTFSFSFGLDTIFDPAEDLPWEDKEALLAIRDREAEDALSARNTFRIDVLKKTSNSNSVSSGTFIEAWTGAGDLTVRGDIGDWVQLSANFNWSNNATVVGFMDIYVVDSTRFVSTGSTTGATEGVKAWTGNVNSEATYGKSKGGVWWYQLQSGDVKNQEVTFRVYIAATAASRQVTANANYPAQFAAVNFGKGN